MALQNEEDTKIKIIDFTLAFTVVGAVVLASEPSSPIDVKIDGARPLQHIDGFGATGFADFEALERGYFDQVVPLGVTYKTTPEQRKAILETAVRELGVTHARLNIWPGVEEKNDNDDPQVMNWSAFTWNGQSGQPTSQKIIENRCNGIHTWGEFLKLVVPLGLENWIVTPAKMPNWLRSRLKDLKDPDRFEEYAEWAAAHLLYLKKSFGFEAPYWSIHNEPDNIGWVAPEFWVPLLKATGARFRKEGLKTKLMFPDFMNVHAAVPLVTEVLKDEEVRQYIGALAYHHYRSSGDGPQPFLEITSKAETADSGTLFDKLTVGARGMAELGRKYHLPSWQTETGYYIENYKELTEWQIGRARANEIYYELVSGASAVQGMCLLWPDAEDARYKGSNRHEGIHILLNTDGKNLVRWEVSKDCGAVFAHYARFVRPGDKRLHSECGDPFLRVTAFASEKNRRHIAVVVNNSNEGKTIRFHIFNPLWKLGYAGGLVTDATRTLESHPLTNVADVTRVRFPPPAPLESHLLTKVADQELCYETVVPALSLTTFVWAETDPGKLTLPDGTPKR